MLVTVLGAWPLESYLPLRSCDLDEMYTNGTNEKLLSTADSSQPSPRKEWSLYLQVPVPCTYQALGARYAIRLPSPIYPLALNAPYWTPLTKLGTIGSTYCTSTVGGMLE